MNFYSRRVPHIPPIFWVDAGDVIYFELTSGTGSDVIDAPDLLAVRGRVDETHRTGCIAEAKGVR